MKTSPSKQASLAALAAALTFLVALPAEAEIALRGRVADDSQGPIAGAQIELHRSPNDALDLLEGAPPGPPAATTTTDAAGRFDLRLPEAGFWRVEIAKAGFVPARLALEPIFDDVEPGEAIELARDRGCRVRVVDESGKPLAGATVIGLDGLDGISRRLPWFGRSSASRPQAGRTDKDGSWSFACPQPLAVTAWAKGFAVLRARHPTGLLTLTLRPGVETVFRTLDEKGKPLARVGVAAAGTRTALATSDAGGRLSVRLAEPTQLVFTGPEGESATLHAATSVVPSADQRGQRSQRSQRGQRGAQSPPPSRAQGGGTQAARPEPPRDVVLRTPASIEGTVTDAATRRPIAGAFVWTSETTTRFTRTNSAGRFELPAPGDRVFLAAQAAGYLMEAKPLAKGATRNFALAPERRVTGVVTDENRKPLDGVRFTVSPKEGRGFALRGAVSTHPSDASGRFRMLGLAPDQSYTVQAEKAGYGGARFELTPETPSPWQIALPRGSSLTGRIVNQGGEPIAGARLVWSPPTQAESDFQFFLGRQGDRQAGAGADGKIEIKGLVAGRYSFRASAPGYGTQPLPQVELATGSATDLGDVVLATGAILEGIVVDREGIGIAGVEISEAPNAAGRNPEMILAMSFLRLGEPLAISDSLGKFTVGDRRPAERLGLSFSCDGYAAKFLANVEAGAAEPLRVVLDRSLSVSGRILDEDKHPVPDADVSVQPQTERMRFRGASPFSVRSDADGVFRVRNVPPGLSVLQVYADEFERFTLAGLELVAGQDLADVEVTLRRGASLSGQVLDEAGRPVEGASVMALQGRTFVEPAVTDSEGGFRVSGLPTGRVDVRAMHRESGRQAHSAIDIQPGENSIVLRFASGVTVAGFVRDTAGRPIEGASINLMALTGGQAFARLQSDATGAFRTDPLPDGSYRVLVWKTGFVHFETAEPLRIAGLAIENFLIQLASGGSVEGEVRGLPAAELASLNIRVSSGSSPGASGKALADGSYRVDGLEPGSYEIEGRTPDGKLARVKVQVEAAETARADLVFGEEGATLSGTVLRGGEPFAAAEVRVAGLDTNFRATQFTDPTGSFRIEGVPPGRYSIAVSGRGLASEAKREVSLPEQGLEVEITVGGAFVAGRVVAASGGEALAGAAIFLEPTGSTEQREPFSRWRSGYETDSRGVFVFDGVPAGTWRLVARQDGFVEQGMALTLEDGEREDAIELRLEAATTLVVEVRTSSGEVPNNVVYQVLAPDGAERTRNVASPDGEGKLRIESLPIGSGQLLLRAFGFAVVELPIVVPSVPLRVVLAPEARIDVEVPSLVASGGRATLTLERPDGTRLRSPGGSIPGEVPLIGGIATLSGVPSGEWTVVVRPPEGAALRQQVTVSAGERKKVVLEGSR